MTATDPLRVFDIPRLIKRIDCIEEASKLAESILALDRGGGNRLLPRMDHFEHKGTARL